MIYIMAITCMLFMAKGGSEGEATSRLEIKLIGLSKLFLTKVLIHMYLSIYYCKKENSK